MDENKDPTCGAFYVAQLPSPTHCDRSFQCFLKKIFDEIKEPHFDVNIVELFNLASAGCDITSVLLDSPTLRPLLCLPTESSIRDEAAAHSLRDSGNLHYKRGHFAEALKSYNNSILRCERETSADCSNSECLPLSYGNRSAVLYQQGEFHSCLADIDAAIAAGYPSKTVHKLHERKVRCLLKLNNCSAAANAVTAARESLSVATVTDRERQEISKMLDGYALTCETAKTTDSAKSSIAAESSSSTYPSAPPLSHGTNEKYTAFSSAVDVVENDHYGKHVICKQKIEVGDVVAVEEPLVALPLPTSLTTHCYFCLQRYGTVFYPCRRCSVALYCSQACESRSWSSYHRYECYRMLALTADGHPFGHLALRATLVAGLIHYTAHSTSIVSADHTSADSQDCAQCPPGYNNLLRQGIPKEAYSPSNVVALSILSVYLALCTSPEIVQLIPSCTRSGKSFLHHVAAITFKHLAAFTNRSHCIYETEICGLRNDAKSTASAIYPLANLFNHSCNANVYRSYHGSKAVMRSMCTMQPGDQVFDAYGACYVGMGRSERQSYLNRYNFECKCVACEEDWPTKDVLSSQADVDPLPSCVHKNAWSAGKRQCPSCVGRLSALASELKRVAIQPDSGHDKGLVKTLTKILADLHLIAAQPHYMFADCREKLKFCFALMGNSYRVVTSD